MSAALTATSRRQRRVIIDPTEYFSTWDFHVPRHFWNSFDVRRTTRIQNKLKVRVWTVGASPFVEFEEGDVFYARSGEVAVQVLRPRTIFGVRYSVSRPGFSLPPPEFHLSPEELGRCLMRLDLALLQSRPI